jgi:hypothetical protein
MVHSTWPARMWTISVHKISTGLFALAIIIPVFLMSGDSSACGLTTHWYIGGLAVLEVKKERPDLADLLNTEGIMYRRGTTFPDAAQEHLKEKYGDKDKRGDPWSHNQKGANGGFFTAYLDQFRDKCGTDFQTIKTNEGGNCRPALAFFFGMINHAVADGPWHKTWIGKTTGGPCKNIPQVWGGEEGRHGLSDHDIDVCLSSRLNGNPADIAAVAASSKAKRTKHKVTFLCPKGQFFDLVSGGKCWSCPKKYNRTLYAIGGDKACSRPAFEKFKKAKKKRKNKRVGQGCPKGQFWDVRGGDGLLGACYSCGGYNRTAYPIKHKRACSKLIPEKLGKAENHGKGTFLCPEKTFPQIGKEYCYTCPADTPVRYPQYDVSDSLACQRVVTAHCSRIKLPVLQTVSGILSPGADQKRAREDMKWTSVQKHQREFIIDTLHDAYEATGASVDVDAIDKEMTNFYVEAMKEPLAVLTHFHAPMTDVLSPYAGDCPWAYENVMNKSQKGSIPDSAAEVAKAMIAIWDAIVGGKEPIFARHDSFYYSVKVGKKTRYCFGKCN